MTSPEIRETTQMSIEALQKRITALEQENKRLKHMINDIGKKADANSRQCSRLDFLLNDRIEDVLSKMPRHFWKKILVSAQQESEIGRLEDETEIPEDLHQQNASSKDLMSMEGQLEDETEILEDLHRENASSKDLMSMEGRLEDETEIPEDLHRENASSKDNSKQFESALLGDISKDKDPPKQDGNIVRTSNLLSTEAEAKKNEVAQQKKISTVGKPKKLFAGKGKVTQAAEGNKRQLKN